jgi:hypothetical protein
MPEECEVDQALAELQARIREQIRGLAALLFEMQALINSLAGHLPE